MVAEKCLVTLPAGLQGVAAYQAAIDALTALWRRNERGAVVLRTDNRILAGQYAGTFGCSAAELAPLLARLRKAGSAFASLSIECATTQPEEPYDAAEAQQLCDGLIARMAASGEPCAPWCVEIQARIDAACAAGDMAHLRAICAE